jgi:hypothetical protein
VGFGVGVGVGLGVGSGVGFSVVEVEVEVEVEVGVEDDVDNGAVVSLTPPPQAQHACTAVIPSADAYSLKLPHSSCHPGPGRPVLVQYDLSV